MNQQDQIKRQINAAKDYLRRLHPRFEEERKQREEFMQEKEAELKELEKENRAISPQLEPCPFCGSMPVEYNGCIRCEAPDCYVQPGVKSEMPEFLPKLWNQMATIESECEKPESDKFHQPYLNPCVRCGGLGLIEGDSTERRARCYSCDNEIIIKGEFTEKQIIDAWNEENPILNSCAKCGLPAKRRNYSGLKVIQCPDCMTSVVGKTMAEAVRKWNEKNPENEELEESDPWKHDCKVSLNPCAQCGTEPQSEIEGDLSLGWVECPNCGKRVQAEENVTPEKLVYMWNEENPLNSESSESDSDNPFKPCAKCGSPAEWEMSLSGRRGWVKCPRCGNEMTIDDEEHHSMEEWVEMWNQANTKPENQIPPKFSQVMKEIEQRIPVNMLNKLYLLNSILGLQRDEKGPVIEVKKIQETILEIDRTLQKGEIWKNDEVIGELIKQIGKMKSDEYLAPSENRKIPVHGSVYVTALHIARAACREAEMYAWEYEQKHGIEELSQVCKYLDQLAEWLFVRAEYLREMEECF